MPSAAPLPKREAWAACTALLLISLAVFWPWLFAGRALYWGDMGVYFQPLLHFERVQLAHGTLPLWNPLVYCGTPFLGNPQTWPLYPATFLVPWLPASRFLTVSCVLHLALGGAFFWLFLRRGMLRLGPWPSLLGAAAFMLDGFVVTKAQYPNMLQAVAWTPLILLLTERLIRKRNARAALGLGLALGLQLLAAHAQMTLYTLYLALILVVFRLWGHDKHAWLQSAGWGIAALCVGLGLSCGQWLPVVDARRLAVRQALSLARVNRLHLPWVELTNFVLPYRYGSPLRGNYGGAGAAWETACYAGTVTVVLAIAALVYCLRVPGARRETCFWLAVFAGSAWLATGMSGGLFPVVYALVPGMKLFHDPARFLLGTAIALPVLGALGLQAVLQSPRLPSPRLAHWAGAACLLALVLDMAPYDRGLYPTLPVQTLEDPAQGSVVVRALRADPVLAAQAGRVLAIDNDTALEQFQSWTDYQAHLPGYIPRLAQTMMPNLPALAGIAEAEGYEPLVLARSARLSSVAVGSLRAASSGNPSSQSLASIAPLLGWMSVRAVVAYRPQPPRAVPGLAPLLTWADADTVHHGFVQTNTLWQPRARVYPTWQVVPTNAPFALSPALLSNPAVEGHAPASNAAPGPPTPATLTRDDPDCVAVALPAASLQNGGLLVLADTHFPGWHAFVDNHPAPLLRANGVFRAVVVPPHARGVVFSYQPVSVRLGLYISLLTTALLLAGGVGYARKERA